MVETKNALRFKANCFSVAHGRSPRIRSCTVARAIFYSDFNGQTAPLRYPNAKSRTFEKQKEVQNGKSCASLATFWIIFRYPNAVWSEVDATQHGKSIQLIQRWLVAQSKEE
ncbi:unnamed protein product [Durusdinium trenchii]|uniref:Uncharacterized protein n=1 Tax=Durusdinium trenchii TaxID=1381693 RepID=A0ABP0IEE6_9DINO